MQSYLSYNEIKKWLETEEDDTGEDGTGEDGTREDGNNHFDVIDVNQDSELIEDPDDSAALGMALCLILVQNLLF